MQNIVMRAVGIVKNHVKNKKDVSWAEDVSTIVLDEEYYAGLKDLEAFSHVIIIYYLEGANFEKNLHL